MVTAPMRPSNGGLYGRFHDSGHGRALTKIQTPSILANVLYRNQYGSTMTFLEDFEQVTFNGDLWTQTKDAGATSFAIVAGVNGMARGITGTTSGEGLSMIGPAIYSGSRNVGIEARMKVSLLTNVTFEMSLIDDITDKTAPSVTDVDVPTFGAGLTEGAAITMDTAETVATPRLCTKGATSSVKAVTLSTPFSGWQPASQTGWTPTADTYFTYRLQTITPVAASGSANTISTVEATIFDSSDPKKTFIVAQATIDAEAGANVLGGITAATLIRPYFAIATLNTTSKNFDVDYVVMWQDR